MSAGSTLSDATTMGMNQEGTSPFSYMADIAEALEGVRAQKSAQQQTRKKWDQVINSANNNQGVQR